MGETYQTVPPRVTDAVLVRLMDSRGHKMVTSAIIASMVLGSAQDMYTRSLLPVGTAIPKTGAKNLQGRQIELENAVRGKRGAVLYFWHLGSRASTDMLPLVAKTAAATRDVTVILVNHGDDATRVKEHLGAARIELPCLLSSPEGENVAKLYGVTGFPTVYTVTPGLKVASVMYKPTPQQLNQAVSALGG